ncbi:MAG TPA: DUF3592 domain-containing protein [Gemmatimonadaceae bacterium]|nr:DUF3592 domain-containing protein [Gemmatimonadaceae bacterium]
MQITVHDENRLVLHQGPWGLRAMGVLFAALGSLMLWYITHGHLGEHNAWVAVVVGGVFAIVGIAMMALAGDLLCTFDKGTRTVTIRHRRLVHPGTETYNWSDIQDAALEKTMMQTSRSGHQEPTYRPVFVMTNGTRAAWTPLYTNALKQQANCVAAVRAFTGWHAMAGDAQIADTAAIQQAATGSRTVRRFLFPFLGIFVAAGVFLYAQQVRRYLTWVPVRARITKTDLATSSDDKGTTYRPVIWYAYHRPGGDIVLATGTTILTESSSYSWANGIRQGYRVGDSVTAYINPASPSQGFLRRQLSWFPLVFVALPLLLGAFLSYAFKDLQKGLTLVAAEHVPMLNAPSMGMQSLTPDQAAHIA